MSSTGTNATFIRWFFVCSLAAVLSGLWATPAAGDAIHLKNGKVFQGRLIDRDTKSITFEIHRFGSKMSRTFSAAEVSKVVEGDTAAATGSKPGKTTPAKGTPDDNQTRYMVIPIHGAIGTEVTNKVFNQCLNLVKVHKPDVVILDIDSPGGVVMELREMLKTLEGYRKFRTIAYVKGQALSCAAILTLGCKEIVVAPEASIGGAVVYHVTPDGTPANIEEKMQSILRSEFRNAAKAAGHNPLLVEGMMRSDLVLYYTTSAEGRADVTKDKRSGRSVLKERGRIVTLDATQAVRCGLAKGQAKDLDELRALLGIEKWKALRGQAAGLFGAHVRRLKSAKQVYEKSMAEAGEYYERAGRSRPSRGRYQVDERGRFSPQSAAEWRNRSDRCAALLKQCEQKLKQAQQIIRDFPYLGLSAEDVERLRGRLKAARESLKAERNRRGL